MWSALAVILLLALYLAVLEYSSPHVSGQRLDLNTFVTFANQGRLRSARVLDQDAIVVGRYAAPSGVVARYNLPYFRSEVLRERLADILLRKRVPTTIDQQFAKSLVLPATLLIPALIVVVVFIYLILSYRRGTGLFGVRSGARRFRRSERRVTFDDIAGQQAAITELRELVGFLSEPERFVELGAQVPRGVLLYGPPGCGKTLLARALAGEAGASFYSIAGSDFVELYVGVGAARVRDLFKEARVNAPAIVFIDELDSVGRRRSGPGAAAGGGGEQEQALNAILTEMDGFSPLDGIIVIGATNRPDVLDPALLRPGRFDRSVGLERPSEADRHAILSLHAASRRLEPDCDLVEIARRAHGMTGADLASVINEAALLAARAEKPAVSQAELDAGLERVLEAPERQRRLAMRDRSVGRRSAGIDERVTFADVAGVDEAIEELREIRDYLAEPERYADLGARIPHGILLYGPPGCGKTMLARAIAGEANAAFLTAAGTEFVEVFAGEGAGRVRDLFAEARTVAPAIVFIDEIDAIGARRSAGASDGARERDTTLNQILVELDGFDARTGVIVIAATNRPDILDPALIRPGRFDRHVGIALPDRDSRRAILAVHAQGKRLAEDADLDEIARRAHGMSGADLASVVNEAALLAARAQKPAVSQAELEEGLKRILEAPERQRRLSMRERTVGRRASGSEERVTFADVAGVDDAVAELREIRDYLAEPERFAKLGARIPRGVLLSGPPGCGKTMLAKAVAGEANAAFLTAAGTEFVEVYVGEGAGRVRDLFAEARTVAPAVVFIDEIDSVGARRSAGVADGARERETTLNQILVELDGFDPRTGVIVIGATNRLDILDPALIRPGRFDRQVELMLPDRAGRRAILALHARGKHLARDVDLDAVAAITPGYSGADLAGVLNEAALLAGRAGQEEISGAILSEAVERVVLGIASSRRPMSEEERRIVAYHEAGHAIVGQALPGVTIPHKITITPRGTRTLGYVWQLDEEERRVLSRATLINQMAMVLGGAVAEELTFDQPGSGAADDLAEVSAIARRMVCELGMSEALSHVTYPDGSHSDSQGPATYSEDEKRIIGLEVRRLVEEAHGLAVGVITRSRDSLDRVASALLERETLSAHDLDELSARRPAASV